MHPKGVNSMAVSGLCGIKVLVGPFPSLFPAFMACFSATAGCHFSGDLTASSLIGGCG